MVDDDHRAIWEVTDRLMLFAALLYQRQFELVASDHHRP